MAVAPPPDGPQATPNPYEQQGRARKVDRLVAALRDRNLGPAQAAKMTPDAVEAIAVLAGVKPPSDETWRLVLHALTEDPLPTADELFDQLAAAVGPCAEPWNIP